MYVDAQTIITAGAILTALIAIGTALIKCLQWVGKQNKQDKDIKAIKEEQSILTIGVLACLKGLKEQGCNGPVTEAINKINEHLNQSAHR